MYDAQHLTSPLRLRPMLRLVMWPLRPDATGQAVVSVCVLREIVEAVEAVGCAATQVMSRAFRQAQGGCRPLWSLQCVGGGHSRPECRGTTVNRLVIHAPRPANLPLAQRAHKHDVGTP
jgi:hypothetical protein